MYELADGNPGEAWRHNRDLVEFNNLLGQSVGIPGLKWAMRERGLPAGYARSPL